MLLKKCSKPADPDAKKMRINLMKEMLWNKEPETVELYQLKKKVSQIPQFKKIKLTSLKKD